MDNQIIIDKYISIMGEIADLASKLKDYAEDHGGISPDEVDKFQIVKAEHIRDFLRRAATRAHTTI